MPPSVACGLARLLSGPGPQGLSAPCQNYISDIILVSASLPSQAF